MTACSTATTSSTFPEASIEVGDVPLRVWVADESSERRQGLMDVEALPGGIDGMLFIFDDPVDASFTMRDTLMELDIWWFDPSMTLVGTTEMEPCESEPCARYGSPGPVRWALETPAGEYDLASGARLDIVESG